MIAFIEEAIGVVRVRRSHMSQVRVEATVGMEQTGRLERIDFCIEERLLDGHFTD